MPNGWSASLHRMRILLPIVTLLLFLAIWGKKIQKLPSQYVRLKLLHDTQQSTYHQLQEIGYESLVIDDYTTWWKVKELYLQHSVEYLPLPDQARSALLLQRFKVEEALKACERFAELVVVNDGQTDSRINLGDGTIPRIRWGSNVIDNVDAIEEHKMDKELLVLPLVDWDLEGMLRKHCPEAFDTFKQLHWDQSMTAFAQGMRKRLEGFCALHSYGGIYMDSNNDETLLQGNDFRQEAWFNKSIGWNQILNQTTGEYISNIELRGSTLSSSQPQTSRHPHKPPKRGRQEPLIAFIKVTSDVNSNWNTNSSIDMNSIISIASPPRHPFLNCLLQDALKRGNTILEEGKIDKGLKGDKHFSSDVRISLNNLRPLNNTMLKMVGSSCSNLTLTEPNKDDQTQIESSIYIQVHAWLQNDDENVTISNIYLKRKNTGFDQIILKESTENSSYVPMKKPSLYDKLMHDNCIPNIEARLGCHYCLRSPLQGSMTKCLDQCPSCWKDIMYSPHKRTRSQEVILSAEIKDSSLPHETQIPRIIHQTWFENVNTEDYPDLVRLQNSWKQAEAYGFEYRFYTDTSAFEYIRNNFPSLVLQAYETLQPGAFKVL